MGFPIRKSADQRLFAPPHGLSQRTTSFIASQRQGIHRIPLRHLIALIINTHPSAEAASSKQCEGVIERPFASNISENIAVKLCSQTGGSSLKALAGSNQRSDMFPLHDVRQQTQNRQQAIANSFIQGPSSPARRAGDQPPGGARRDRTDDLMLAKHALSQLSYGPGQR